MLRMVARLRFRARAMPLKSPCNVGAGAHRDTNVGLGERGRVVHTVSGHSYDLAFRLKRLHMMSVLRGIRK
jgi:hypothetical protein